MQIQPTNLIISTLEEGTNQNTFSFGPLPKGYGYTIGNALRRVLLTSLEGAAVTQIKISGADHQFATIPGIKEDVVELTLNFKKLRFKSFTKNPIVATIDVTGPGEVTAKDIEISSEVEILNKDLHIATLADKKTNFKVELIIETGLGYSPMESRESNKIGTITIDATFSPVLSVSYKVEPTRFGKELDLDKLILSVETDGSIMPRDAVKVSASILSDFLGCIKEWDAYNKEEKEEKKEVKPETTKQNDNTLIEDLPLPTRTINALKKHGIETLGQLASKKDEELADIKNLGEKSVLEIKKLLKKEGIN